MAPFGPAYPSLVPVPGAEKDKKREEVGTRNERSSRGVQASCVRV